MPRNEEDSQNLRPFQHFQPQPRAISTIFHLLHFVTPCYTKIFLFLFLLSARSADWPALHGNPEHTGRSEEQLHFPLTLQWAVEFENERFVREHAGLTTGEGVTFNRTGGIRAKENFLAEQSGTKRNS